MTEERPKLQYSSENSYFYHLFFAFLPLIGYGIYKNGILPFLNHDSSWIFIFKPLFLAVIGFLMGYLVDYFRSLQLKKKLVWKYSIYGLAIALLMPFQISILFFAFCLLLFLLLFSFFPKITISPLWVGSFLFAFVFGSVFSIDYRNATEIANEMVYSMSDILFGRSIGGICNTSILISFLSFLFLCFDPFYKKEIAISYLGSYFLLTLVFEFFFPSGDLLRSFLQFSIFYSSTFLVTEMYCTPYLEKGKILFGIGCGILSCVCIRFVSPTFGAYFGILIGGLFAPLCDFFFLNFFKKDEKFCRMKKF